jgi:hypothetical protein
MALPASNALVVSGHGPDGKPSLGLVVNRAYRMRPNARAEPLDAEIPVSRQLTYAPSTNQGARPRMIDDHANIERHKPFTDVLLVGSANAAGRSVASLDTGVAVGAARKGVRVLGARRVEVGSEGKLGFTSPEPFTTAPLTWDHAYGGRDVHAERLMQRGSRRSSLADARDAPLYQVVYPRNGAGRGYYLDVDRDRLHGALLPSLEDPTDPVTPERLLSERTTEWIDRPVAAGYGPIDVFTFPRSVFLLKPAFDTPTRPVQEICSGAVLAEDILRPFDPRGARSPRVYNRAPAGLAVCRLAGGERVSLWNLHWSHALFEFDLPADRPRLLLEPPGAGTRELQPVLQTVLIEPDKDWVTLTWTGSLEVAAPYPEKMMQTMRHVVLWSR